MSDRSPRQIITDTLVAVLKVTPTPAIGPLVTQIIDDLKRENYQFAKVTVVPADKVAP
jgi:hypothetical protein